ncbi:MULTISPECIES: hypothetical protein [unclassified Rhizobium]|uniref:hypothetical protein n=1 Tax=unclassified Rhizobium TaxID=2613769 RepID=UPI00288B8E53|nr:MULTISPECIES: hypothetical protein [unclassified Rhizobium]
MSPRKAPKTSKKPVEPETLNGSNTLPAIIEIAENQTLQLGDIVMMAHQVSGLSVGAWNELADDKRDEQLKTVIENVKAAVAGGASLDDLKEKATAEITEREGQEIGWVTAEQVLIVSAPGGPRRRAGFAFGPEPIELTFEQLGDTKETREETLNALRADPKLKIDGRMREIVLDDNE